MKKRALACLLLISIGLQPIASVLATEPETPTVSSEEKMTKETIERPLDTMTQELLEGETTPEEETPTETTDSIDEPEAPIDIEPPAPTPETLSAPRAVTTVPWGQTICTIEGVGDYITGYTITVRASSGIVAGTPNQAPWIINVDYRDHVKTIIFDGSYGKIILMGNMDYCFYYNIFLQNIDFSGVDTSLVTSMKSIFYADIENIYGSLDTRNVTDMSRMFYGCRKLRAIDLSNFNTSNVTDMSEMFAICYGLTDLNLSNFDTHNVTNMSRMFSDCSGLTNLNLSNFNNSNVTNMEYMFKNCSRLTTLNLSSFNTSNVQNMNGMFQECYDLQNLNLSNFDTRNVTEMSSMFRECENLSTLDLSSFIPQNVINMNAMFSGCIKLSNINLSQFDTRSVTDMGGMFSGCSQLSSLDVSGFDTSQVTNMSSMFSGCSKLGNVDLSQFDTRSVTNMSNMFKKCSLITSLDLSYFDTRLVTNMGGMFQGTNKLRTLKLGSQTLLKTNCSLRPSNSKDYTGKWTTLGTGTLERPNGDWSGTVAELCARSQTGVADTYVWEPKFYTITFDVNGGSNVPNSIKAYKNDVVDLSTVTSPAPPTSAYGFAGWTTVIDDFTTKVETLTMPANDVTLYAHWKVLMEINSIPDEFIFKHNVMRNEYTPQFVTLNSQAYTSKAAFKTNWQSTLDWKLTVTMAEWRNPDDATDTLTGVQMFMNNQLTHQDGSPAPSTIHSNQQVVLNAGETQTLVTTTAGNSADGTGNWQSTIDFDSVKLKIPRYGGREGSYYTSQLTWSLDDTI
ncbi:BspA family leucine-rich repeat surface protein [Vagococcus lutrae]|uniref:BspA family leucine-rich repeat surface protein n=1 Tax=Vagococcus lutrae TaxID=81947 RepID=UPI000F8652D7|nr:BspA family leucine-rich repeat surface protein [Vagococcus lutrae]RST92356.1 hypothetical protein CBF33_05215 [Vagococcus lutrae]